MKTTTIEKAFINLAINELMSNASLKELDNLHSKNVNYLEYDHEPTDNAKDLRNAYVTNTLTRQHCRTIAKTLKTLKDDYGLIDKLIIKKLINKLEW